MRLGRSAGVSHPGRKRRRNEDSYVVDPPLFAVVDGMGGAQAGDVASKLAAAALRENAPDGDAEERVIALVNEANRRVFARASEDQAASGMGTTMTVALVDRDLVWIGHVGDSRAYLLRDGRLDQLTDDHSLVGELVRSGKLSEEEAQTHPQRSVITRAVGTDPDVDVDTFPVEPRPGDLFLICSDGLTDMVDDRTIRETIEGRRDDLDGLVRALVTVANKGGGEDNITVVAFEIAGDEAAELDETRPMPAAQAPEADEEDTLSELDRVPAVDTMIVSADEVERWSSDREPDHEPEPERRRGRRLLPALLLVVFLAGLVVLVAWGVLR